MHGYKQIIKLLVQSSRTLYFIFQTFLINENHVKIIKLRLNILLKKDSGTVFFCEFYEISKNTFFYVLSPVAASGDVFLTAANIYTECFAPIVNG